jgi:CheY-like chemotaxis protein
MRPVILHLEDNSDLAEIVELAFQHFGFDGEILHATTVKNAMDLIRTRTENNQEIDLIIVDMNLPDGTGLEVVQRVKSNPVWASIPIIVLSNQWEPDTVADAYALGANCYLPKDAKEINVVEALYRCWVEATRLPVSPRANRAEQILGRAVSLATQISKIYAEFTRLFVATPSSRLWIDLALSENNNANLLSFFRRSIRNNHIPPETLEKISQQVQKREERLHVIQNRHALQDNPTLDQALSWALELQEPFNPKAFAMAFGVLFPNGQAATEALKESMLKHLSLLCRVALAESNDPGIHAQARALQKRLAAVVPLRVGHE